ncbi:hypothetical protein [Macrococcus carouselicus]|uniref:Uncharacterized protein n=1 Tax=Macrococcus carouselicus TaxID=69969 RepID=A0A9Q8CN18_9STAP|nr:hypothetical protein [Macrococcus carouselicus]TDM03765.1 hypothetical protein ERX40_00965 [Macrococcus carouselicus]
MKKKLPIAALVLSSSLFYPLSTYAATDETVTPNELTENGVSINQASDLAEKINAGIETEAEKYLDTNDIVTSDINSKITKTFEDGSFIEQKIEELSVSCVIDKNEPNKAVSDVGGILQADRILHVTTSGTWGSMGYYVRVYKPLSGQKYIKSVYGQHYGGTIQSFQLSIIRKYAGYEPAYANGLGHSAFGPLTRSINLQFYLKDNGGFYSVTKDM